MWDQELGSFFFLPSWLQGLTLLTLRSVINGLVKLAVLEEREEQEQERERNGESEEGL